MWGEEDEKRFNPMNLLHGLKKFVSRLVLALGAESKLDVVPGAMELAFPFYTLEDAIVRVRSAQSGVQFGFFGL
ncbi:hypothetical protein ARALYDRAFT_917041 [Arabidopsis lyrata subsp. lyrata]|uniref:Uncharacterized protein n=1 Tax=Arabidopsis lyrata subsp. lyrata TaxID=81972 RepID=D7MKX7_ARALL|nr:hypothetical protein ARALYDRAFT_917041 [Arabidopsis lyrata subsp. lyrata]